MFVTGQSGSLHCCVPHSYVRAHYAWQREGRPQPPDKYALDVIPGLQPEDAIMNTNTTSYLDKRKTGGILPMEFKKKFMLDAFTKLMAIPNILQETDCKEICSMDIDQKGRLLLSGGKNGKIFVHNLLNAGKPGHKCEVSAIYTLPNVVERRRTTMPAYVTSLQWSPWDAGLFVCTTFDGTIRIFDVEYQEEVDRRSIPSQIFDMQINEFRPYLIAVGGTKNNLSVMDTRTGNITHMLFEKTQKNNVMLSCCWSPTESPIVAAAGEDSVIRIWDIRSQKSATCIMKEQSEIQSIINGITFTIDARSLVAISGVNNLHTIDIASSKRPKCLKLGHQPPCIYPMRKILPHVVGYDGFNICIAPYKNTLKVYSLNNEKALNTLEGHYDDIQCCSVNQDRMEMYSGANGENVLFWSINQKLSDESDL